MPRHPDRFAAVGRLLDESGIRWARRSELQGGHSVRADEWRVLLVDKVGELGAWWGTAKIAFVGGSLGDRGGQNMIEPAAYGAAVSFGTNTRNFRDIVSAMLARRSKLIADPAGSSCASIARPGIRYCFVAFPSRRVSTALW